MSTASRKSDSKPTDQRKALQRSENHATTTQPQNFRDEANADKVVAIPPDEQNAPIQGIDPPGRGRKAR